MSILWTQNVSSLFYYFFYVIPFNSKSAVKCQFRIDTLVNFQIFKYQRLVKQLGEVVFQRFFSPTFQSVKASLSACS